MFDLGHPWLRDEKSLRKLDLGEIDEAAEFGEREAEVFGEVVEVCNVAGLR